MPRESDKAEEANHDSNGLKGALEVMLSLGCPDPWANYLGPVQMSLTSSGQGQPVQRCESHSSYRGRLN